MRRYISVTDYGNFYYRGKIIIKVSEYKGRSLIIYGGRKKRSKWVNTRMLREVDWSKEESK